MPSASAFIDRIKLVADHPRFWNIRRTRRDGGRGSGKGMTDKGGLAAYLMVAYLRQQIDDGELRNPHQIFRRALNLVHSARERREYEKVLREEFPDIDF